MAIAFLSSTALAACKASEPPSISTDDPDQSSARPEEIVSIEALTEEDAAAENATRPEASRPPSSSPASAPLPTLPTTPIKTVPKVDGTATAPATPSTQAPLSAGTFVSGGQAVQGSVKIIDDEGTPIIQLGNDFQTSTGSDLFVVLHVAKDVLATTAAPSHSLKDDEYVVIAALKSHQGAQDYSIPAAIILDHYNSVAIWHRQSNTTLGSATLAIAPALNE